MADQIRATPRSPILGLFSDLVNLPLQYMSSPERTQQMQGTTQFLYGTGIPKTLERISYGDSLFSGAGGLGGTTRMRPETAEALLNVAPFAPVAGRVAGRMIKATEGMPVGMGIKDVGKGIASNTSQFTGFKNTTPYGKAKEVATYLDKLNVPYTINKSKTTNSAYLEIQTGKGDFDYPMQFRFSDHSTDLPHQNRQIFTNPKPDPNFDLDMFKGGGHDTEFAISKINELIARTNPITTNLKSPYPQQAALTVKPPTDDIYEVMDATFNYGKLGGNKTIPIDQLTGGVRMSDPTEARRVKELADKISSPDGYISRIIVDDAGNVLEGQHRLEALRLLGEKNVPVSVIEDLSNKYDISAMENAIQGKFRSDQSTQLVRQAIDTLEEAGSVEKALSDYSMPAIFQQPFQDAIRASQKVTPTQIESPAFTDPFGNTIGSSIR